MAFGRAGGLKNRRETEEAGGKNANSEGKGEDGEIQVRVREAGNATGIRAREGLDGPSREQQSRRASQACEKQAFGKQLPREPGAAGAERGADGKFAPAACHSRQHHVSDVGAGEQKDKAYRAEQHQELIAKAADDSREEGRENGGFVAICLGIGAGEAIHYRG